MSNRPSVCEGLGIAVHVKQPPSQRKGSASADRQRAVDGERRDGDGEVRGEPVRRRVVNVRVLPEGFSDGVECTATPLRRQAATWAYSCVGMPGARARVRGKYQAARRDDCNDTVAAYARRRGNPVGGPYDSR